MLSSSSTLSFVIVVAALMIKFVLLISVWADCRRVDKAFLYLTTLLCFSSMDEYILKMTSALKFPASFLTNSSVIPLFAVPFVKILIKHLSLHIFNMSSNKSGSKNGSPPNMVMFVTLYSNSF